MSSTLSYRSRVQNALWFFSCAIVVLPLSSRAKRVSSTLSGKLTDMGWCIYLLGDIRLTYGEREMTRFESRKVVQLLARVALHPMRLHPREELAALLWPDADRRAGLERLRHVLSSLARQIALPPAPPESLLIVERQSVRLNHSSVWCDAAEFETHFHNQRFVEASALYKGDLLPGDYDGWVQDERERLCALYEQIPNDSCLPHPVPFRTTEPAITAPRARLPHYLTAFFGRETERSQLQLLLRARRLITLTGMGGCGKTRLAVEVAREASFATTVWVPLADCVEPAQILHRLRTSFGLAASGEPLDQIASVLGDEEALLVLDNMEQMAAGAAEAVEALLATLPHIRCLVTSRALLHIPGEQAFPLAPLPLPPDGEDAFAAPNLDDNPGVALFMDRARATRPDFVLTMRNRKYVLQVCRLLDGLPLALELASARIRAYSPTEMCRQLQEGQRFALASRPDAAQRKDPRHGSLRGAVGWSWRLLAPRLQDFLASVAVLRGHWGASIAQTVAGAPDAAMLLEELLTCSLVQTHQAIINDTEVTRFSVAETIRDFAGEQLTSARRHDARRAHARQIIEWGSDPVRIDNLMLEDPSRLIGALEDAVTEGEADEAFSLCHVMRNPMIACGSAVVVLSLLQRALSLPGGNNILRVKALLAGVDYALVEAELSLAAQLVEDAALLSGPHMEDASTPAAVQSARAHLMYLRNDPTGAVHAVASEALMECEATGNQRIAANLHVIMGMIAKRGKQWDIARWHFVQAEANAVAVGRSSAVLQIRFKQAIVASDSGDFNLARHLYDECLVAAQRASDRDSEANILCNRGSILGQQKLWDEAIPAIKDGISAAFRLGNRYLVHIGLWNLSEPLAYTSRGAAAAILMGWVDGYYGAMFGSYSPEDTEYRSRVLHQAETSLPPDLPNLTTLLARGEHLSLRDIVTFAFNL